MEDVFCSNSPNTLQLGRARPHFGLISTQFDCTSILKGGKGFETILSQGRNRDIKLHPWNSVKALRGPWATLWKSITLRKQHSKGRHYQAHRDVLECVTSPWRRFDSLKRFPQSENSKTQLDIASHHKVKALSPDPYERCGLRSKILWLCDSTQILIAYFYIYFCFPSSPAAQP